MIATSAMITTPRAIFLGHHGIGGSTLTSVEYPSLGRYDGSLATTSVSLSSLPVSSDYYSVISGGKAERREQRERSRRAKGRKHNYARWAQIIRKQQERTV